MDDIQIWGQSIDWVSGVLSVAVIVLPTLAAIIVTALLGAQALPAFRKLVRSLREYVDQPTDSVIVALAKALNIPPEKLSEAITKLVDEAGKEPTITPAPTPLLPPHEVALAKTLNQQEVSPPDGVKIVEATFNFAEGAGTYPITAPVTNTPAQPETRAPDAPIEAVS